MECLNWEVNVDENDKIISRPICLLTAVGFWLSSNMAQTLAASSDMMEWDKETINGMDYGGAAPDKAKNPGHARIMAH